MLFMVVCVFLIALVADVLIKLARSYSSPIPRVLYLREITSPPSSMVIFAENQHKNPFIAEFVLLFENLAMVLDYAVMKYVGEEVRILSRQEGKHAKLHLAAVQQRKKEGESATRWKWLLWLADKILLRCGRTLGISLVTHIEASAWVWVFLPSLMLKGLPALLIFHGMEEVEHGALTVQALRKQIHPTLLLLTFPLAILVHVLYMLCPPIMVLLTRPRLLLLPQSYPDLFKYYTVFALSFAAASVSQILFCIIPLPENQTLFRLMHQFFNTELKTRGITFNIVEQETYKLY